MDKKNEIIEDIKRYSRIEAISNTEGGKIVLGGLRKDISSCISDITRGYGKYTHIELIAKCARLSEQLTLLRVLNRASKLKKFAQEELDFIESEG